MKKEKLAIFDIDGTIFRKNLHFELLTELVYSEVFKKTTREQITNLYGNWVNQRHTYEQHRDKMVSLYRENLVGCRKKDIKKVAQKVVNLNAQRVYIFTKGLIEELREDYYLIIISGSPIEIVGEYAKNFEFDKFFGSVYELDKKSFYTGEEVSVPVWDKGKVIKDFAKKEGFSLKGSVGVGDTESDAKFLKLVERPIAFNPNQNLKAIAEFENWEIVVERKDVIYKI
ncbi:MAG: HAD family phosphatase [Candidatus Moranbacteria bacterium]|nr:HAD family phosphatase [Candidatus Moranbacteria bacterium]